MPRPQPASIRADPIPDDVSTKSPLSLLPSEVRCRLLSCLPAKDLLAFASTSKDWQKYVISEDESIWRGRVGKQGEFGKDGRSGCGMKASGGPDDMKELDWRHETWKSVCQCHALTALRHRYTRVRSDWVSLPGEDSDQGLETWAIKAGIDGIVFVECRAVKENMTTPDPIDTSSSRSTSSSFAPPTQKLIRTFDSHTGEMLGSVKVYGKDWQIGNPGEETVRDGSDGSSKGEERGMRVADGSEGGGWLVVCKGDEFDIYDLYKSTTVVGHQDKTKSAGDGDKQDRLPTNEEGETGLPDMPSDNQAAADASTDHDGRRGPTEACPKKRGRIDPHPRSISLRHGAPPHKNHSLKVEGQLSPQTDAFKGRGFCEVWKVKGGKMVTLTDEMIDVWDLASLRNSKRIRLAALGLVLKSTKYLDFDDNFVFLTGESIAHLRRKAASLMVVISMSTCKVHHIYRPPSRKVRVGMWGALVPSVFAPTVEDPEMEEDYLRWDANLSKKQKEGPTFIGKRELKVKKDCNPLVNALCEVKTMHLGQILATDTCLAILTPECQLLLIADYKNALRDLGNFDRYTFVLDLKTEGDTSGVMAVEGDSLAVLMRHLTEDDPELLSMAHFQERLSRPVLLHIPDVKALFSGLVATPVSHIGDLPFGGSLDHVNMDMSREGIFMSTAPIFSKTDDEGNPWTLKDTNPHKLRRAVRCFRWAVHSHSRNGVSPQDD